jgi:hypothetical protein
MEERSYEGVILGIEKVLLELADRILDFDEASLAQLQEKYLKKVSEFSPTREWERAIVVYFMINSVRVKNKIFNEKLKEPSAKEPDKSSKNFLKVIK